MARPRTDRTNRDQPALRVAFGRLSQRGHVGRDENSIVSPGLCRTPATFSTSSPAETSSSAWADQFHDPTAPVGRLLFNVLAMVAELEADLISMRTRRAMRVAKAKGRLRGKQPKLTVNQGRHLLELSDADTYSTAEADRGRGALDQESYPPPTFPERRLAAAGIADSNVG
jgi:Resolvase, N terminal domain